MDLSVLHKMGLDAVEIVIATEETFGISISDAEAEQMLTPRMLIDHVKCAVGAQSKTRPCLSQRAFHRVRHSLVTTTGIKRSEVSLSTKVRNLFPKHKRVESWHSLSLIHI